MAGCWVVCRWTRTHITQFWILNLAWICCPQLINLKSRVVLFFPPVFSLPFIGCIFMIQIGTKETNESLSLPSDLPTVLPLLIVSACVLEMQSFDEHAPIKDSTGRTKPPVPPSSVTPLTKGSLFHAFFLLLHGTCLIHLHCLTFPAEPPLSPPHHTHIHKASMPFQKQSQKTRAQGFWDSPNPSELSWSGIQLIHCLLGVCSVSSKWGSITLGNNPKYSSCNGAVPD